MQSAQHIFLTGFMGSGKSTLGRKLSVLLHRSFIDLDHYIETQEKKSISFIFEAEGEPAFRNKESYYLQELMRKDKRSVISLGGGTICFGSNLKIVKDHGFLIYLELSGDELFNRIKNSKTPRPLLKNLNGDALLKFIHHKLEERTPYYSQAHLTINTLDLNALLLQQAIPDAIKK